MKQKNRMILNTGTTSLILIFAVLALVVFAALSLASSSAGRRLADKMAERTTQYYAAQNRAVEILSEVEQTVERVRLESSREEFLKQVQAAVESMEVGVAQETERQPRQETGTAQETERQPGQETGMAQETGKVRWEDGLIRWEVAVSERQQIEAAVRPVYDAEAGDANCVTELWSVTETRDWEGGQALELYR